MEEEHLIHLCIMFDCLWEHNLRLKPTKCEFFQDKINYLAHHISKEGMQPIRENLKSVAEFSPTPNLHGNLGLPELSGAL